MTLPGIVRPAAMKGCIAATCSRMVGLLSARSMPFRVTTNGVSQHEPLV